MSVIRLRERLTVACLEFPVMVTDFVVLRTGDEIFSNVKAGMVNPLFVELKHGGGRPGVLCLVEERFATINRSGCPHMWTLCLKHRPCH